VPLGLRAKIAVVAGLSFALMFLVLGIREMRTPALSQVSSPIAQPAKNVSVLYLASAARSIHTGETITADMVRNTTADPNRNPSIVSAAEAIGKVATLPIPAGALIARSAIGNENKLAIRVPVGMRAISIDTTAEIAVAGLIRPGDRVDVQVVYPGEDALSGARSAGRSHSQTLLQMAQVLAVGDVVVGTAPVSDGANGAIVTPPPPARTVTLALSPEQVSTLSLAKNTGALYLSLRNPTDQLIAGPPRPAGAAPVSGRAGRVG
jgi:pilus assembly protein CpaB